MAFVIRFQKNLFNQGYSSSQENANYLNVQNDPFTLNNNNNTNNSNTNINNPNGVNNNTSTSSNNFIYDLTNEAELLENSAKKNDKYTVRRILDAHYSQFQIKSIEQINSNRCRINTNTSKINEEFTNYRLKSFRLSKYFNNTPTANPNPYNNNNSSDPYQQSLYNQLNFINNKAINNFHNSLNNTTAAAAKFAFHDSSNFNSRENSIDRENLTTSNNNNNTLNNSSNLNKSSQIKSNTTTKSVTIPAAFFKHIAFSHRAQCTRRIAYLFKIWFKCK